MRRLAALAALLLVAAGCGWGGGGKKADNGGGKPGSNRIAQAASTTLRAGSAQVAFTIAGAGFTGRGSGVFNNKEKASARISMSILSKGQTSTIDTVVAGTVFYLRTPVFQQVLPRGKAWVRVDLAHLAKREGVDLGSLVDSNPTPTGALAYLHGVTGEAREVGKETVRGVETTHYKATVDLEKAAKNTTGATHDAMRRVIDVAGVKRIPVEVWIDGDGYVRKIEYRQHSSKGQSAIITMELHDFGGPVPIASPPASSVVDFQGILKPQGG